VQHFGKPLQGGIFGKSTKGIAVFPSLLSWLQVPEGLTSLNKQPTKTLRSLRASTLIVLHVFL
jgi:hypothetical protein